MNNGLERKYKMCTKLHLYLDENPSKISAVPKVLERTTGFKTQYTVLDGKINLGMANTTGHTKKKADARDKAAASCFRLANAIWGHADDTNDEVLKAKFPVTTSDFQYGSSTELKSLYREVMKTATGLKKELELHGITESDFNTAKANLEAFETFENAPLSERTKNAVELEQFTDDFRVMDTVLTKLDNAMDAAFDKIDPFLVGYYKMRRLRAGKANIESEEAPAAEKKWPKAAPVFSPSNHQPDPVLLGGGPYERPKPQ